MTPQEKAAEMVAAPEWEFRTNFVKAISHATSRAADAAIGFRAEHAQYWTHVSVLLCEAAGHPKGAVLVALVERYGEPAQRLETRSD